MMNKRLCVLTICALISGGGSLYAQAQDEASMPEGEAETITLSVFSEPVELTALVELAAEELGINIHSVEGVTGSVALNAPVTVPKTELLSLIDSLLGQQGFAMTFDEQTGWYGVVRSENVSVGFEGMLATTRIINIPNVKPSILQTAIQAQLGSATSRITALDELGVLMVTDTAPRVRIVEQLVERIIAKRAEMKLVRIDIQNIAAPEARARAIELMGKGSSSSALPRATNLSGRPDPRNAALNAASFAGTGAGMSSIADRLLVYSQGNALIFRGRDDEVEEVKMIIEMIDRPDTLIPRRYHTRGATSAISQLASKRGLGEVVTLSDDSQGTVPGQPVRSGTQAAGQDQQRLEGGSVMVVSIQRGDIVYYATEAQHEQMAKLVAEYDTDSERVVTKVYKLYHTDAADVADLIQGLVDNQRAGADNALLPGGQTQRQPQRQQNRSSSASRNQFNEGDTSKKPDEVVLPWHEELFVQPDPINNQLLIKAPVRQQGEFGKLISKIDLRRPQVYIEAKIISITANDSMRLAFETQLVNAMGAGGALRTNFGLTNFSDTSGFTNPVDVVTGLSGFTAALIKSQYVPIVINALKREADAKILSTPQLLVDDNEEAEVVSLDQQPTTSSQQGTATTQTSFAGFEDAGTSLLVTPHISEEGYLRLDYEIELSNFVGEGSNGIPAPRQQRNIRADSVTIPSDTTIVVGGITVSEEGSTVVKVPLLGDIPLVGHLFRDTNSTDRKTTLYVFITPKIMRDPTFRDLRLLTLGPQAETGVDLDLPELKPSMIPITMQERSTDENQSQGTQVTPSRAGNVERKGG